MRLVLAAAAVSVCLAAAAACIGGDPAQPHATLPDAAESPADAGDGGGACLRVLPPCPDGGQPSWEASVSHVVAARCVYCHSASGTPPQPPDLSTLASVQANFGTSLDEIYACAMPPPTEDPIPPADRIALLTWLGCRAPDN